MQSDTPTPKRTVDLIDKGRSELQQLESMPPDAKVLYEEQSLLNTKRIEDIEDQKQAREQRKEYAKSVYKLIVWWLVGIGVLLLLAGFGYIFGFFHLPDSVLLAIIGGTTVNVLGLFAIVMRHLFPTIPPQKNTPPKA